VLVAVSKGMRAVKLCTNIILQFLTRAAGQCRLTCIMAVKRWWWWLLWLLLLLFLLVVVVIVVVVIPAKARDYVFTGVGLSVCLSVCLFVTMITK